MVASDREVDIEKLTGEYLTVFDSAYAAALLEVRDEYVEMYSAEGIAGTVKSEMED